MSFFSSRTGALNNLTGPELNNFGLALNLALFFGFLAAWYGLTWGQLIIARLGPGWAPQLALICLILPAWGLGAFYWGRQVEGEPSAAPLTGALLSAIAIPLAQSHFLLLKPLSLLENSLLPFWAAWIPGLSGGGLLVIPLVFSLSFFFLGGSWSLLAETVVNRPRHLNLGLAWLWGGGLFGIFLGALGWWLAAPLGFAVLSLAAAGLNLSLTLINLALARQRQAGGGRRLALWPRSTLGSWHGHTSYGSGVDVSPLAAKLSTLALLLGAAALGGYGVEFARAAEPFAAGSLQAVSGWWLFGGLALLAGALAARGLDLVIGPVGGLAVALVILTLTCRLAGFPGGNTGGALWWSDWWPQRSAAWLIPLVVAGAVFPLEAQIVQSRRRWVASSLGLALWRLTLWCGLGALILGLGAGSFLSPETGKFLLTAVSLAAAGLAVSSLLRGPVLILAWAAVFSLALYWLPSGPGGQISAAPQAQAALTETAASRAALIGVLSRPAPQRAREALLISPGSSELPAAISLCSDRLLTLPQPLAARGEARQWPRRHLAAGGRLYDLIVVGPDFSPYSVQGWPLFTREFYQQLKQALAPQGVAEFILPYGLLAPDDFKTVLASWLEIFPQAGIWDLAGEALMLTSGSSPLEPTPEAALATGLHPWLTLGERAGLSQGEKITVFEPGRLAERLRTWKGRNSDYKPEVWLHWQRPRPNPLWPMINAAWLTES